MKNSLADIRSLSHDEIKTLVAEVGEKPYRAKQLWEWLWKKHARSFDDMSDLPKAFRAHLAERTVLRPLVLAEEQLSKDGTVKCAFSSFSSGKAYSATRYTTCSVVPGGQCVAA